MKTTYQQARHELKERASDAKSQLKTDKPAIRQTINDFTDFLCRSYKLTEYQCNLLSNYACKLHHKK